MADILALGTSIKDFQVGQFLGKGGFASVYRAVYIPNKMEVAVKMIDKRNIREFGMLKKVRDEARIHYQMKHPSILELYNCFEDEHYVYLILEFCRHGELGKYLQRHNKTTLSEPEAFSIIKQVLSGLLYLHSHNILHRDLTLSNLLLTEGNHVKIADFGLATKLSTPAETHITMCGTPNYISPEVATKSPHGPPVDVWGLGVLLYTLLFGRPPFETAAVRATLNKVVQEDVFIPSTVSYEAEDLLRKLLEKDQRKRIAVSDIARHPFMWKYPETPLQCGIEQDSGLGLTCSLCPCSRLESTTSRGGVSCSGERSVHSREVSSGAVRRSNGCCRSTIDEHENVRSYVSLPRSVELRRDELTTSGNISSNLSRAASIKSGLSHCSCNHSTGGRISEERKCSHDVPNHERHPRIPALLPDSTSSGPTKPERICTVRLQEKRINAPNAVYYILRSGFAVLETISKDRVVCRLRVSEDGNEVFVEDVNEPIREKPPDLSERLQRYNYDDLPRELWRKYGKLGEFVKMIQSYTYKISLGTKMAACFLMESSPDDFTAHFYKGITFKKHGKNVIVTNIGSSPITYPFDGLLQECKTVQFDYLRHFFDSFHRCLQLERMLTEQSSDVDLFPASFGTYCSTTKRPKENSTKLLGESKATVRAESTPVKGQLSSQLDGRMSRSRRQLEKKFPDGDTLILDTETGELRVENANGNITCFSVNDPKVPVSLVEKLKELRGQVKGMRCSSR